MKSLAILVLGVLLPSLAFSQVKQSPVPRTITYQGVLTEAAGAPVADNDYGVTFRLYDAPTNGTELWSEEQKVHTAKGQFDAILGSVTPIRLAFDRQYWLGVTVAPGSEMVPRATLTSTPYSIRALFVDTANTVGGFSASATPVPRKLLALDSTGKFPASVIPTSSSGGNLQDPFVIYTSSPAAITLENSASGYCIDAFSRRGTAIMSRSQEGVGLYAITHDGESALFAYTEKENGIAIAAQADNGAAAAAIDATSSGGNAIQATALYGTALYAEGHEYGVYGFTTKSDGAGIYGGGEGPHGDGVVGEGNRMGVKGKGGKWGVYADGSSYGVEGYSPSGRGVRGKSDSAGSFAVEGYSLEGVGVRAHSIKSVALSAESVTGRTSAVFSGNVIVFGAPSDTGSALVVGASSVGRAARFGGNVDVAGHIYKSSGSFRIDHPLDPTNKYLQHSFVESPDMKNIYDGVAMLDARGEATVRLPDYFEALNTDFRYQLTCIGGYAPVYIAAKIAGNSFRIAGGKPGLEVSWMVTGSRQDAYAKAHPIATELSKTGKEAGTYLHPIEHGASETMGVSYEEMKRARELLTGNNVTNSESSFREGALRSTAQKERPKIIRRNQPAQNAVDSAPREIKEK